MIKLLYKLENQNLIDIKERFESLALAYKIEKDDTIEHVSLVDGDLTYEGIKAINAQIDQLEIDLKKWWYCDC